MKKFVEILPGFLLSLGIAYLARFLEGLLPIHMIGAIGVEWCMGLV